MDLNINTIVNQEVFWAIIDAAKKAANGDLRKMSDYIQNDLRKLSTEGIIQFDLITQSYISLCHGDRLWSIAAAIKGGCTDDAFEDFKCWLIAQGKDIYYAALKNPDVLAEINVQDDPTYGTAEYCDLYYLAKDVYEEMTGHEMDLNNVKQYADIKNTLSKTIEYVDKFHCDVSPSEFPIKFPKITDKYLEVKDTLVTENIPELPSAEELAKEYLTICDSGLCSGDGSVGIPKCPFFEFPDFDPDTNVTFKGGCRLKAALGI